MLGGRRSKVIRLREFAIHEPVVNVVVSNFCPSPVVRVSVHVFTADMYGGLYRLLYVPEIPFIIPDDVIA